MGHSFSIIVGGIGTVRAIFGWTSSERFYKTGYIAWLLGPIGLWIVLSIFSVISAFETRAASQGLGFIVIPGAIGVLVVNSLVWLSSYGWIDTVGMGFPEEAIPSYKRSFIPMLSVPFANVIPYMIFTAVTIGLYSE